jgi:hypothetical protein
MVSRDQVIGSGQQILMSNSWVGSIYAVMRDPYDLHVCLPAKPLRLILLYEESLSEHWPADDFDCMLHRSNTYELPGRNVHRHPDGAAVSADFRAPGLKPGSWRSNAWARGSA